MTRLSRRFLGAAAVGLALLLATEPSDARAGRGGSFGSRGGRTYSAPPPTNTAPGTAAPVERSIQQPGQQVGQPGGRLGAPAAARPGFFNRGGFMPGLMTGLLGAGLIGMLMGGGFLTGLGSLAGMLGFLLQLGLIAGLVWLALRLFRRRGAPAYATAGGVPIGERALGGDRSERSALGGLGGVGGLGSGRGTPYGAPRPERSDTVGIGESDFNAFERLLDEVQTAYTRADRDGLASRVTPEMMGYFAEELDAQAARGLVSRPSGATLLQGDLAEAWREGGTDFATVAMRYSMVDALEETATGRIVEGSPEPTEVSEVWTFARERGGDWRLSAIQQA